MAPVPHAPDLRVPPGTLVVHAGMPKTGSTALQRTAAQRRDVLLEHGVRYPGTATNHRKALFAFSHRPVGWVGPGESTPGRARWTRLLDEVRAEEGRTVWLSNENLSDEDEPTLRALLDELGAPGRETVVALTVRSLPAQLASAWQQYLKSGVWISFETWLRRTIGDEPNPATTPSFRRRSALGEVVETWVRLVGAERVVVVVLDPADRSLVPTTFEELLGLASGVLEPDTLTGAQQNRSLTAGEAELLRRVNRAVRDAGDVAWRDYERFVRQGAVESMLARRRPRKEEQRIVPPAWAVERAVELAKGEVARIAASGVRVVGDLAHVAAPVPSVERARSARDVPVDAAAEALLAVISTALGRGPDFAALEPTAPQEAAAGGRRLDEASAGDLAQALGRRAVRRARRLLPSR
jgi:hypothetical protein